MKIDDRLNRFLTRYTKERTISNNSYYYTFSSGIILRVSNHYASTSDGAFSVIIPSNGMGEQYILVRKSTGESKILSYEELKTFIKALNILQEILLDTCSAIEGIKAKGDELKPKKCIPVSYFSPKQLQQVRSWLLQKGKKI